MPNPINAKNAAIAFAVAFVGAGVLGFIPNPLVAPDGIFAVNALHNLVHILTGAAFLIGAVWIGAPRATLQVIGVAYVAVTVLGFLTTGDHLLGLIHINEADRWLHAGLAAVILGAGLAIPDETLVPPAKGRVA